MANFNLSAYDEDAESSIIKEFTAENLDTIIKEFEYFLRGAGFDFPGTIELVPFETDEPELGNTVIVSGADIDYQYAHYMAME
jgi:hypothetical protein